MFRQFIGLSDFARKLKLKLSLYGVVVRHVRKAVKIRSRIKRKSAF